MTPNKPPAPKHLSADAKRAWSTIVSDYEVSPPELLTLEQLVEAYGLACAAWRTLAAEGLTIADRYGSPKQHPALASATAMATLVMRASKALGIELPDEDVVKLKGRGAGRPTTTRARRAA